MTTHEPGCGEPWVCDPCDAVNHDIRQRCRLCKKLRSEIARLTTVSGDTSGLIDGLILKARVFEADKSDANQAALEEAKRALYAALKGGDA